MNTSIEEIALVIRRENEHDPVMIILKNGSVEYYTVRKATYRDHVELHGANKIQP